MRGSARIPAADFACENSRTWTPNQRNAAVRPAPVRASVDLPAGLPLCRPGESTYARLPELDQTETITRPAFTRVDHTHHGFRGCIEAIPTRGTRSKSVARPKCRGNRNQREIAPAPVGNGSGRSGPGRAGNGIPLVGSWKSREREFFWLCSYPVFENDEPIISSHSMHSPEGTPSRYGSRNRKGGRPRSTASGVRKFFWTRNSLISTGKHLRFCYQYYQ